MMTYKTNKSKLIFDINKIKTKITQKQYSECMAMENLDEALPLSELADEELLSLRATLAYSNYQKQVENQEIVEKSLDMKAFVNWKPKVYWTSLREFRLNNWRQLGKVEKQLIATRTKQSLTEHVLTNSDEIKYYYYTLERNLDEVLRL